MVRKTLFKSKELSNPDFSTMQELFAKSKHQVNPQFLNAWNTPAIRAIVWACLGSGTVITSEFYEACLRNSAEVDKYIRLYLSNASEPIITCFTKYLGYGCAVQGTAYISKLIHKSESQVRRYLKSFQGILIAPEHINELSTKLIHKLLVFPESMQDQYLAYRSFLHYNCGKVNRISLNKCSDVSEKLLLILFGSRPEELSRSVYTSCKINSYPFLLKFLTNLQAVESR